MAITTVDGWFGAARQNGLIRKPVAFPTVAAMPFSLWAENGNPGAGSLTIGNTANGIVPTQATAGAPAINTVGAATAYLARAAYRNSVACGLTLYDRLFHVGSISLTSLATTTLTAQPDYSGRLPGGLYTGLEILLEVNAAVSASAVTVSVGYMNEAGVTGHTTPTTTTLASLTTKRVWPMALQAGDSGVQKIESVTVSGTVATTGSVNVIVARRVGEFDVRIVNGLDAQSWDMLGSPVVYDTSCLWGVVTPDSTSSGAPTLGYTIISG